MEAQMPNSVTVFLDMFVMKAWRVLFRIWKKISGNTRPSNYPYISGDSFRAIADHLYDETSKLNPKDVMLGDIVFVSNPMTRQYLLEVHPLIKHSYILIEHNGDFPIDKSIADLLDDKIVKFYAQDVTYAHEKIIPIPIGLENYHYHQNGIPSVLNYMVCLARNLPKAKRDRILFRFSIHTNPTERGPAHKYFSSHPLMETFVVMLSPTLHMKRLMTYKFVASPPGNSIESSRTWEALHFKTVPIVKDFVAMRYFASLGLPLWIVRDWKELDGLSEQDLAAKYELFMKSAKWDALHMDFWIDMIRKDQEKIRNIK